MTAQTGDLFFGTRFIEHALQALKIDGFISDKHPCTPSRDVLQAYAAKISSAMTAQGFGGRLSTCFMHHGNVGYTYILYDDTRYPNHDRACRAAHEWLNKSFGKKRRGKARWTLIHLDETDPP